MHGLEDGNISIVLLSLIMILLSREQVCFHVLGARLVVEGEVILCKFRYPSHLSSVQLLWKLEVLEVLMIGPDLHILSGTHKVMAPL